MKGEQRKKRWLRVLTLAVSGAFALSIIFTPCGVYGASGELFQFRPSAAYLVPSGAGDYRTSAASARDLVLDAPAGKYGSVICRDGHFYFSESGERIRFWGVNMVFSANFPETHEKANSLAEEFANMGVNLVRLHGFDSANGAEASIFKEYAKSTRELSSAQLDKLDYFIYALKERGIYIDLGLNAKRVYTEGDGVAESPKQVGSGGKIKSAQYFDEQLIELQKEFARALLLHTNPYTNRTYASEPAIAMIELLNETSMFSEWAGDQYDSHMKGVYAEELNALWNAWLTDRYGASSALSAAWGTRSPQKAELGAMHWLRKSEIKKYPEQPIRDFSEFMQDTQRAFFEELRSYLRDELGVVQPISGNNLYSGLSDLASQDVMDYTQNHAYFDHPIFPFGWSQSNYTMTNESLLDTGFVNNKESFTTFFGRMPLSRLAGKPFVLSEWGHQFPNEHEYESPLLVSALASVQDWDGVVLFAYSHYDKEDNGAIGYWFDIRNNPSKRAQMMAAAVSFLRGDVAPAAHHAELNMAKEDTLHHGLLDLWTYQLFSGKYVSPMFLLDCQLSRNDLSAEKTSDLSALLGKDAVAAAGKLKVFASENGQILWTAGSYAAINTARTQVLIGDLSKEKKSLSNLALSDMDYTGDGCAVSLLSVDGGAIGASERMLLTVAGHQENNGQRFGIGRTLLNWGSDFVKVARISGKAEIRLDAPERYAVYALKEDGTRMQKLETTISGGALTFSLGAPALWYEIAADNDPEEAGAPVPADWMTEAAEPESGLVRPEPASLQMAAETASIQLFESGVQTGSLSFDELRRDNGYYAIVHSGSDTKQKGAGMTGEALRTYVEKFGSTPLRLVGEQVFCDFPTNVKQYEQLAKSAKLDFDTLFFTVQLAQVEDGSLTDALAERVPEASRATYPIRVGLYAQLPDGSRIDVSSYVTLNGGIAMQQGMDQNNSSLLYYDFAKKTGGTADAKYTLVNGKFAFETKINAGYAYMAVGEPATVAKLIPPRQVPLAGGAPQPEPDEPGLDAVPEKAVWTISAVLITTILLCVIVVVIALLWRRHTSASKTNDSEAEGDKV